MFEKTLRELKKLDSIKVRVPIALCAHGKIGYRLPCLAYRCKSITIFLFYLYYFFIITAFFKDFK